MDANRVIAMFNTEDSGHLNPMLCLAGALVERGWKVHFYVPRPAEHLVKAVGATWRHMGTEDFSIVDAAKEVIKERLDLNVPLDVMKLPFSAVPATIALLPYLLSDVARLAPRFIVHDACAPWGNLVADKLQVPAICLMTALPRPLAAREKGSNKYSHEGIAVLDAVAKAIKQDYDIDLNHNHSYEMYTPYTIVTSSRAWHKGHEEFPASQFHYWGGALVSERKGSKPTEGTDAVERLLSDSSLGTPSKPFVFCSLGTVTTGRTCSAFFGDACKDYYQKLCNAAELLPHVTFVLAVGQVADVVEEDVAVDGLRRIVKLFGDAVPANVVVARSVNQPKVLSRANAFVTHCGQNSACEAVQAAVPVITAPFFGDQISNALRFEELGCGFAVSFHPDLKAVEPAKFEPDLSLVSPDSLAASMRRLLEEPQFRQAMIQLRAKQDIENPLSLASKLDSLIAYVDDAAKIIVPQLSKWSAKQHEFLCCGA